MMPGVSYKMTWAGPSVKAPRVGLCVVFVLCDTAAICIVASVQHGQGHEINEMNVDHLMAVAVEYESPS